VYVYINSFSFTCFCSRSVERSLLVSLSLSARKSEEKFVVIQKVVFSPNCGRRRSLSLSSLLKRERKRARAHTHAKKKKIVDPRRRRGIEINRDNRTPLPKTKKKKKKNTKKMKKELSQSVVEKLVWIAIYSLCSSSMLVVNKLAVAAIPLPTVVSGAQLVSSALVPLLMQVCGAPVIGKMTTGRVAPYVVYTSMFAAGLFANMKALLLTNVGAVIAARCCLPLIVSVIEYVFMGRSWPNKRSMVSLVRF
jgi:hypothetical protein